MRLLPDQPSAIFHRPRSSRPGWLRNEDGVAAIEFAIVACPSSCSSSASSAWGCTSWPSTSLEYGAEAAARKVRTGEADKGDMTVGDFKHLVCDRRRQLHQLQ